MLSGRMFRFLFLILVFTAVVALFTKSPRSRQGLWAAFGLVAIYALLKATGVIEAIAPSQTGVF